MVLYSNTAVDNLAERYIEKGGEIITLEEGCLTTYGHAVFFGPGLKTTVVRSHYIDAMSSGYAVRKYNRAPAKYQAMIDAA